ncbi:MAG TPA: type IV toxin-antitoxin system AbiEi family antitoxin domain-containing protein [Solirubrobacterales bacterium]|nr:type IV toxin-antitoxin system AbiEi family antitoxin domain-containing protein [Solirubrobacterales bacterium]
MKDREATALMRSLAERQHGVFSTWQLLDHGVNERIVYSRRVGGLLVPLHQGVYALAHARLSREGRAMAAVLACGPGAVLSHFSAGRHWGFCGSVGPVEVLRQSGGLEPKSHKAVRLHQTRRLQPYEVTVERGIPVAVMERVLLDLSGRIDAKRVERMFVQAHKRDDFSWSRLARITTRRRGCKGVGKLRRIALEIDPEALETKSPPEVDFLALWREVDDLAPSVNVLVEGHLVDFLWAEQKVIVETDSWTYHGDPLAFERDRQRDVELTAAGYDVHRTTAKMLERDPDPFLKNVRRALRTRTASGFLPVRGEI